MDMETKLQTICTSFSSSCNLSNKKGKTENKDDNVDMTASNGIIPTVWYETDTFGSLMIFLSTLIWLA